MKKFLLPLLALAAFNFGTAQEESIRFGIKAGLNFANLVDEDLDGDIKIGINGGAVIEIPLSEKFALQPEVLFSMQGLRAEQNSGFNLNYINIPIMAKYYISQGLSLQAGPQLGILVSSNTEFNGVKVDSKDIMSSIDLGVNFGAGYQLSSGIFFDVRYNLGLTNVFDFEFRESFDSPSIEPDGRNSVISISLGYKF